MNILIIGCCGVVGRAIARSIKLSKHYSDARIIGADVFQYWYALHESLFDGIYRVSDISNQQEYSTQVRNICASEAIDLVIVTPEKEVLFWAQNGLGVPATLPSPRLANIASDKSRLYELLATTGLVPDFAILGRAELLGSDAASIVTVEYPLWIRDFAVGSDSGKGALKAGALDEVRAWVLLNKNIDHFMLSAFLPGRNFACCMLFDEDKLLKSCSYERLEYFMGPVSPSGVTGNISRGRLVNEKQVLINAETAMREIARQTGERICGLFTVDLREDKNGIPLVTEINIRHTAATSAYAAGGCNMVEAQVHHGLNRLDMIDDTAVLFPENNYILRDIDGPPVWVHEITLPEPGDKFHPRVNFPC